MYKCQDKSGHEKKDFITSNHTIIMRSFFLTDLNQSFTYALILILI